MEHAQHECSRLAESETVAGETEQESLVQEGLLHDFLNVGSVPGCRP